MAKIAFILLTHKDPDGIIAQAQRLTATGDYVSIHFDARAPRAHFDRIRAALAGNPSVLLADEPTAALDSQNGALIMGLIRELADKHGRAVVIVTHDPRIQSVADRVAFMEDGRLREPPAGDPD